eukprot:s1409_g8.t1
MKEVLAWADMEGDGADETTVAGSFLKLIGATLVTKPRLLSTVKTTDVDAIIANWRIPTATPGTLRAPTLVETGQATLTMRACQLVGGKGKTLAEMQTELAAAQAAVAKAPPTAPAPTVAASPPRKVKMTAVASQVDDTEVSLMEESELVKLYKEYERVYGPNERPPKDSEPTSEQISAIAHLLDSGLPPFADFAIFGPYGHRIERKVKLSGMTIGRDGQMRQIELHGPPNIGTWLASYNVLMTILVMKRAVDLGILLKYRSHVERLHDRYSDKIWAVLYQAESRCRLELMDRLRREAVAEHDTIVAAGGISSFEPDRPWNTAWQRAANHEAFWREEVIEPGMLILTKISGLNEMVDGDATVKPAASAAQPRETHAGPSRITSAPSASSTQRTRKNNRSGRIHQIEGGKYTANRTGRMHGGGTTDDLTYSGSEQDECSRNSAQCVDGVSVDCNTDMHKAGMPQTEFKILYLFSGPKRSTGGFEFYCTSLGMTCRCIDIEYDPKHNLLCQDFWEGLLRELDQYDAYLMSPPCSSFTMARTGNAGPGPLRGAHGRDRYGLSKLSIEDKQKVKEGTLLARRANTTACRASQNNKPWILEQPHWRKEQESTSMFMLDEFLELAKQEGVEFHTFDQCTFGADFEKKTDLMSNIDRDVMAPFSATCTHEKIWWVVPWSGEEVHASHPPLRGKQKAIPFWEWREDMLRHREPYGDFLTRGTAAYPDKMNEQLALCLKAACERRAGDRSGLVSGNPRSHTLRTSSGGESLDPQLQMSEPLTGRKEVEEVDEHNSLRNVHRWISPRMKFIGKQIQNLIQRWLNDNPNVQTEMMDSLGKQSETSDSLKLLMKQLRGQVRDLLGRNSYPEMANTCSIEQVNDGTYETEVRGELLHFWSLCVDDPGQHAVRWLLDGAPAGLVCNTEALDGVFPRVDNTRVGDYHDLVTEYDTFANYSGVEDNEEATKALESYAEKGYLMKFGNLRDLEMFLGEKPILSKIGCIVKQKVNHVTGATTTKTRIILDCKASQVSLSADRTHKSVLPRVSDAVQSTLAMQADLRPGEVIEFLVADIVDAFWLVPLKREERRFFCAKLGSWYYCFLRTAQGSRAAPLTFAAIISVASRFVQSVVSTPLHVGQRTEEARVQTYVDDPLFSIRGSPDRVRLLATIIMVAWTIMGFPLAFHKATLAPKLTWIGVELSINPSGIEAVVPSEKVLELTDLLQQMLRSNVIAKKSMRTAVGKAMSIASVLFCWRPFLQELYMALHTEDTKAPRECIWTKQVRHTLLWLLTFLKDEVAGIRRQYTIRCLSHHLPLVTITWDASPWGMGATLQLDGSTVEYFSIQISSDDEQVLETKSGTHEGQQVWEALAGLIALRQWTKHWFGQRARLQIRSDNVGALTMLTKLKGGSRQLSLLAREYALDLGQAQWKPDLVTHIPGVTNTVCDMLSRKWAPSTTFKLPESLKCATEVQPPPRSQSWWRTLDYERQMQHRP